MRVDVHVADIFKTRLLVIFKIIFFGRKKHPGFGEKATDGIARLYGADEQRRAAGFDNPKSLIDSPLRVGPIFDAARTDVAVESISRVRNIFGIADGESTILQVGFSFGFCHLLMTLIYTSHVFCRHPPHDTLRSKTRARAYVDDFEGRVVEFSDV